MVFKVDFENGNAVLWEKTSDRSVESTVDKDYHPRFYIEGEQSDLREARVYLSQKQGVDATCFEYWKPTLRQEKQKVLRVDTNSEDQLQKTVHRVKDEYPRHKFRFHNVGFSPQFRYCLQKNITPVPSHQLTQIQLKIPRRKLNPLELKHLKIDGEKTGLKHAEDILALLNEKIQHIDPDIIKVDRADTLKTINKKLEQQGYTLGRKNGFQQLAGSKTVNSYGKTVHKSSRYNIPGRILINQSNSFLLKETNIKGLLGLVERSLRPLQELAWSSIGRTLTSIETRRAYHEEETLTPWKNYNYEKPKKASTLHKADTGGFIFNPEPSFHQDVYQADFASLFPNIMIKKNISPETVDCNCCKNQKTPQLNYTICQKQKGFIPKVLKPLVEDRQEMKDKIKSPEVSQREKEKLKGRSDAIKWLLVSCFGYMGHAHASYGAIECHQAIQAYDREIMIQAKEIFEKNGYKVVHGIIDSLWVQKNRENPVDFEETCKEISEEIGIELEPEEKYEWCGFVPRRSSSADIATLNRYFGKTRNGFEKAGIQTEQSSTPRYIKKIQNQMIKALDQEGVEGVLDKAKKGVREIENQEINTEELVVEKTISKSLENYQVENRSTAAIKRAKKHGTEIHPGQKVRFIVTNDNSPFNEERVKLPFEKINKIDEEFYKDQLIKATQTVLSPKTHLDREKVRRKVLDLRKNQKLNLKQK